MNIVKHRLHIWAGSGELELVRQIFPGRHKDFYQILNNSTGLIQIIQHQLGCGGWRRLCETKSFVIAAPTAAFDSYFGCSNSGGISRKNLSILLNFVANLNWICAQLKSLSLLLRQFLTRHWFREETTRAWLPRCCLQILLFCNYL